ncbi:MAG: acyl-CoA thioesterase [Rhodocyclaceae bacterium]|nr:acyl-CoA thioesterase [Rhodocyclaceae bacterium]
MDSSLDKHSFRLRHELRVRWAEVDAQNIVFNAHYLAYFDIGITEYWRAIGLPYPENIAGSGGDLYVVKSLVNYHAAARYDDQLEICVRAARVGNSSMAFDMAIFRGETCLITGEVVYVFACPDERKSRPLPANLRDAVASFEARG